MIIKVPAVVGHQLKTLVFLAWIELDLGDAALSRRRPCFDGLRDVFYSK